MSFYTHCIELRGSYPSRGYIVFPGRNWLQSVTIVLQCVLTASAIELLQFLDVFACVNFLVCVRHKENIANTLQISVFATLVLI